MQTRYKLPPDVKIECIAYVRGYERRLADYNRKRENILNAGRSPSYDINRVKGGAASDSTFDKAAKLQALETHFDTKVMRAVEQAKNLIGVDEDCEREREKLIKGIVICCKYYKTFNFAGYKAKFSLNMSRSTFYRQRDEFLHSIYKYLEKS